MNFELERDPIGHVARAFSMPAFAQAMTSPQSSAIPKLLQVGGNRGVQLRGLGLLLAQRRDEPLHLLLERLAIVLLRLGTDIPAGRQHVAVLAHVFQPSRSCRSRGCPRTRRFLFTSPGVVGVGDAGDVLVVQLAVRAVHE